MYVRRDTVSTVRKRVTYAKESSAQNILKQIKTGTETKIKTLRNLRTHTNRNRTDASQANGDVAGNRRSLQRKKEEKRGIRIGEHSVYQRGTCESSP